MVEKCCWEVTVVEVYEINIRICNCLKDDVDTREAGYELRLRLVTKFGTMIGWSF